MTTGRSRQIRFRIDYYDKYFSFLISPFPTLLFYPLKHRLSNNIKHNNLSKNLRAFQTVSARIQIVRIFSVIILLSHPRVVRRNTVVFERIISIFVYDEILNRSPVNGRRDRMFGQELFGSEQCW